MEPMVVSATVMMTDDLINKEPCGEEEADAHKDEGEVGEDGGVDGGDVAGEGVQGGHGHLGVCKYGGQVRRLRAYSGQLQIFPSH